MQWTLERQRWRRSCSLQRASQQLTAQPITEAIPCQLLASQQVGQLRLLSVHTIFSIP
jgi:hypothetical protein